MRENNLYFYPMRMLPVYKNYLWGGQKLKSFNKKCNDNIIAESWEVSCNNAGLSKIANGYYKDKYLSEVINLDKLSFLGENASKYDTFPILIKLIDAKNNLSIQVHPTKENANTCNGETAKSELWYIIDCEKDSFIYYGFKKDISKNLFLKYVNEKKVCDLINKIYVKPGQGYYIPAGTIHALGKGIIVAEIQQNSNTTFRIYDYDRKDAKGNLRPLHINRAAEVLNLKKFVPDKNLKDNFVDFNCDYFHVNKVCIDKIKIFNKNDNTFNIVQLINGNATIVYDNVLYDCKKGDTFFIPAKIKNYKIEGFCELLITQL